MRKVRSERLNYGQRPTLVGKHLGSMWTLAVWLPNPGPSLPHTDCQSCGLCGREWRTLIQSGSFCWWENWFSEKVNGVVYFKSISSSYTVAESLCRPRSAGSSAISTSPCWLGWRDSASKGPMIKYSWAMGHAQEKESRLGWKYLASSYRYPKSLFQFSHHLVSPCSTPGMWSLIFGEVLVTRTSFPS